MRTRYLGIALLVLLAAACGSEQKMDGGDAGTDADTDADTDTDIDSDTDPYTCDGVPETCEDIGPDQSSQYVGCCEGDVVYWCQDQGGDWLMFYQDCAASGLECAFLAEYGYVWCVGDPEDECTDEDPFDPAECGDAAPDPCLFHVDGSATEGGDGLSWEGALTDVQDAIDAARCAVLAGAEVCQVWVAAGTYYTHRGCDTDTVRLRPGVELYGGFTGSETDLEERDWEANETVLHGADGPDDLDRVRHVVHGSDDAIIDGFTVTGGNDDFIDYLDLEWASVVGGAGMHNREASPIVENCVFSENSTIAWGGAIQNVGGSPQIINCTFLDNFAEGGGGAVNMLGESVVFISGSLFIGNWSTETTTPGQQYYGGAIEVQDLSQLSVEGSSFVQNSGSFGGAIGTYIDQGLSVENCSFEDNSAEYGGAIYTFTSPTPTVVDSRFTGNSALFDGGAVYVLGGTQADVTSCVFDDNSAVGFGGALVVDATPASVANCTFTSNEAEDGGAVVSAFVNATTDLENSILWGDSPNEIVDLYNAVTSVDYCDIQGGYTGAGNLDADPLFVDASSGDLHLAAGSPCIDSADGTSAPTEDLEGNPRVDDPGVANTGQGPPWADMGAYERQP